MEIITAYATENDCYKKAQKMTPKGIVVHSTGANNPNLKRYVDAPDEVGTNRYGNHWNTSGLSKCVHAFIGYDKDGAVKIANILPYTYCCWGVGSGSKGSYNYDPAYIQFEMCEDDCKNEAYFEAVYRAAVEYCVYLCKEFDLPVENIVSHREAYAQGYGSNHGDPDNWWKNFGRTMDDFRADVGICLIIDDAVSENTDTETKALYRVQIGAFSNRENAEALAEKLKASGFDAYIVAIDPKTDGQEPATSLKSIDEIADEVLRGLWGNGSERKQRLTAAGYDYDAVQKRVNERLKSKEA